jgi:hypothetical protein
MRWEFLTGGAGPVRSDNWPTRLLQLIEPACEDLEAFARQLLEVRQNKGALVLRLLLGALNPCPDPVDITIASIVTAAVRTRPGGSEQRCGERTLADPTWSDEQDTTRRSQGPSNTPKNRPPYVTRARH